MENIYMILDDIIHRTKKIRDFSSGDYRGMAVGMLIQLDRLVEKIEEKENKIKQKGDL